MSQHIEVLITPDGQTSIQTLGFTGSSCQPASRFLEEALGRQLSEQRTPDFYQAQVNVQQEQQRLT